MHGYGEMNKLVSAGANEIEAYHKLGVEVKAARAEAARHVNQARGLVSGAQKAIVEDDDSAKVPKAKSKAKAVA